MTLRSAAAAIAPASLRVMLVEDSAVVRGVMSRWIAAEPGFSVVGAAGDGREALDLVDALRPDIVLLDLEMPVLDGLSALPQLLARRPGLSVIVVSTLTRRNAGLTLACMAAGAVECLTKPEMRRDPSSLAGFRDELLRKLRGLAPRHLARQAPPLAIPSPPPRMRPAALPAIRPRAIGIGASTGGPTALVELLRDLAAANRLVPILVVQHMPELFTAVFADQLRAKTGLTIAEGRDGEPLRPGRIYIAPGGRHMGIASPDGTPAIRLDGGPPVNHCRPAVDVLFADLARIYGPASLGIVLTGMGHDGTDGAEALGRAAARVFVQDEATSVIWGMPGSIARAGLATQVLPLDRIGKAASEALGLPC